MKKAICFLMAVITVIGVVPIGIYAEERPFPDVPADAWYAEYFIKAYEHERKIVQGDNNGNMMPGKPMTRAEAVTLIRNHCKVIKDFSEVSSIPFADVPKSAWYYEAVKWAYCYGIAKGVGNNQFKPNDYVTREDFAVMMYRCYNFNDEYQFGLFFPIELCEEYVFLDSDDISGYAVTPMSYMTSRLSAEFTEGPGSAVSEPIMIGNNGYIMPKKVCTRAEAVKIIIAALESEPIVVTYDGYQKNSPYLGT